jgi:hypothetical protein
VLRGRYYDEAGPLETRNGPKKGMPKVLCCPATGVRLQQWAEWPAPGRLLPTAPGSTGRQARKWVREWFECVDLATICGLARIVEDATIPSGDRFLVLDTPDGW